MNIVSCHPQANWCDRIDAPIEELEQSYIMRILLIRRLSQD